MGSSRAFTLADHVLINAAAEICVVRVFDPDAMRDVLATFREVMPRVSRDNPMIEALAVPCSELQELYRLGKPVAAARFRISEALGVIFRWKHAASRAAMIREKAKHD